MYDLLSLWEYDVSNDIIIGDIVKLQEQISKGWDINTPIAKYALQGIEKFPVMLSIQYNNFNSLEFLVKQGAKLDIGNSHAFLYSLRYSDQFLQYVIEKGAKVKVYERAFNAYDIVAIKNKMDLIPTIKKAKLPLHPYAVNACFNAIYNSEYHTLDAFIRYGFDLNNNQKSKFNLHGNTALGHAAMYCDYNMLKHLIQNGADPSIANQLGKTPYILAKEAGKTDNIRYLKQFISNDCFNEILKYLPTDILEFVQQTNLRLNLKNSNDIKFIDFLSASELYVMHINKQKHIMLTEKFDLYPDIALLWNPQKNSLAYFEEEHRWYGNFNITFNEFLLDPLKYINNIFTNKNMNQR